MKTPGTGGRRHSISRLLTYFGISTLLFVSCLLFWVAGHPELLSYHEQYQLFLFTSDYFGERIAVIGGLADYISEFIVQFYYVPWIGATLVVLVIVLIQILLAACCFAPRGGTSSPRPDNRGNIGLCIYALSTVPSLLLMYFMGDINLLLSYPVAIMLTLLFTWVTLVAFGKVGQTRLISGARTPLPPSQRLLPPSRRLVIMVVGFVALYWAAGPVALLYPLMTGMLHIDKTERGGATSWANVAWGCGAFVVSCLIILGINRLWFVQYPESQMFYGINYYRVTNMHPASVFVTAASVLCIAVAAKVLSNLKRPITSGADWGVAGVVALAAVLFVPKGYNPDVMEVLRYDMLVRNERWHDIITLAERKAPANEFCLQGLNLALAKTGQLGDRMFEFGQHGIGSLISKYYYDNTSCLISAEVFWHLGMVNSAFRYNFDMQEATMNDRKSGRFLKRMAECMIINRQYQAASKYINMLKGSLYYDDWAKRAEAYYKETDRTDEVPAWRQKRQLRYKQEMLFDYEEIEKMFGLLALESEGANLLAWDYFNAALMLKGDLQTMIGMYHYANEQFNLFAIPKHHQEAIGMFWTFGHQSFEGLPYQISEAVQRDIANLAQVYTQNIDKPEVWRKQFRGNYCVYFLEKQSAHAAQQPTSTPYKGSEREG